MSSNRHRGLDVLRRMARIVTVIVTVAYLLPALLTIMPSPASAAEQALYADLMKSRCLDMNGDGEPDPGMPSHGAHDCCVVCAQPQSAVPRLSQPVSIAFVPRPAVPAPEPQLVLADPPSEAVFRPVSQRGPPA